jgi:hypothetical protein
MTLTEFKNTLSGNVPADNLSVYLKALWFDAKGDWEKAHTLIQEMPDKTAAWIHAYLHRKEGDIWNADYWYTKASKKRPSMPLDQEWEEIVFSLLKLF